MPQKAYWYQGGISESGPISLDRIFIYHVRKTGTTTLFNAVRASAAYLFKAMAKVVPTFTPPEMGRMDDLECLGFPAIDDNFFLVASHLPFGFHDRFAHDFKLVTVLRDTYRRVLSSYTFQCMRTRTRPRADAFQAFLRREENRNVSVKQLSGLLPAASASRNDMMTAKKHLTDNFFMYGTTEDISRICSAILKMNRMPNVWIDHLNKTEPGYRLDGSPFEHEIQDLNRLDCQLYDFVAGNPRIVEPEPLEPHPLTVLVRETGNAGESEGQTMSIPTAAIRKNMAGGDFSGQALERHFTQE